MPIDSDRYGRTVACYAYNAHFAGRLPSVCDLKSLYRPSPSLIGGVHEKVCDGRLVDEATLRLLWQASMTSSRRSGLRALFERRHEVTTAMPMPGGDLRVAYWT